jgi:hypothetical protein
MTSKKVRVRPLKRADLKDLGVKQTIRGIVADLDGEIIGMAGVVHSTPLQAIFIIKDELRKYPLVMMKAIKPFRKLLNSYTGSIYAVASQTESNADAFLKRVGFTYTRDRIYKWAQQQSP